MKIERVPGRKIMKESRLTLIVRWWAVGAGIQRLLLHLIAILLLLLLLLLLMLMVGHVLLIVLMMLLLLLLDLLLLAAHVVDQVRVVGRCVVARLSGRARTPAAAATAGGQVGQEALAID